jgi:hypothetical protein
MSAANDFDRMIYDFFNDDPAIGYYIQAGTPVFNPATGDNQSVDTEVVVEIMLLDLTRTSNGLSQKFGTQIVAGDKEVYIRPPEKTDPLATPLIINTVSDRIRIAGITYQVVVMKEATYTGTSPLLFDMHIRR